MNPNKAYMGSVGFEVEPAFTAPPVPPLAGIVPGLAGMTAGLVVSVLPPQPWHAAKPLTNTSITQKLRICLSYYYSGD